jgi:ligand-binding sensor domain-containing protein
MRRILSLIVAGVLIFPNISRAQEYSYAHYGIAEGLAGATVYCITQDKDGFIWTGTEAGVSRFDGTHFKNFTTKDGLPDLEVLQIFSDSKGRVWMAPFRKSVCFYYKGKIHNQQNDSLLSHIHLRGNIDGFAEDAGGNILMQERTALHLVGKDSSLIQYDSLDRMPIRECYAVSNSASGNFLAAADSTIIEFSGKKCIRSIRVRWLVAKSTLIAISPGMAVWSQSLATFAILPFSGKGIIHRPATKYYRYISFSIVDDSLMYSNQLSGSLEYNINTGLTRKFLSGIAVSRVFRDQSGSLWFTTLGQGIFRLNSNELRTVRLAVGDEGRSGVTAIAKIGNTLWVGDNHNYIYKLSLPDLAVRVSKPLVHFLTSSVLFIDTMRGNRLLFAGNVGLAEGTPDLHFTRFCPGLLFKSAVRINSRQILVATIEWAGIFDLVRFQLTDTLWQERSTVVFYRKDTFYVGTLNGLYRLVKGQSLQFLGERTPFLRKRISSLAESADGTLWIASSDDAGIIGYKDNRQVAAITRQQGLTSDICRVLLVHNNILWVGTDKGLNRVELDKPGYPVTKYSSRDGLASDMINSLFVDSSRVYLGTSDGLSFFDEKKPVNGEGCRLYLLSLTNSGRERIADTANLIIPYTDKRVRLEFAGISYRSAGDITYRYRMIGLDSTWRETKENFLEYPDLPAGNYEWQLIAINKFGNESRLLSLPMEVSVQFWKKPWFAVTAWLMSLALIWLLVSRRITHIRRQQREKERLMQKMSELENTALKSQMNPHFIFNCLNSIQQFIFAGNTAGANQYVTGLARLIRMTLNNSSRSLVSIEEEVDYLSSYLSMEKMRFKDKIDYLLTVDASIDQSAVLIPPMLIQPYVENGLQHGLANKPAGKGFIGIKINIHEDALIVTIEDNGIGRGGAAAKKTIELPGYPSKGMSLTEDRIGILNKLSGSNTRVEIIDLKDDTGAPAGTRIVIQLPLFQENSLYF